MINYGYIYLDVFFIVANVILLIISTHKKTYINGLRWILKFIIIDISHCTSELKLNLQLYLYIESYHFTLFEWIL